MNSRSGRRAVVVTGLLWASLSHADVITKADNADALNLVSSWAEGKVPGTNDVATWNAALTASKTYSLGADQSWLGMAVTADPGGNLVFSSGYTLTLGAQGIASTPSRTITLNNVIELGADQSWAVSSGTFIPGGVLNMAGHTLTLSGGATKQFKGAISGGGRIVVNGTGTSGYAKFTNAGTAAPETDVFLNNANLNFETATGLANGPRTKSLWLGNGASLSIGGRSDRNTVETNANELVAGGGISTVTITPDATKSAMLYSGSFARGAGSGMIVFRGTGLGTNSLASLTPNSANVVFGAAPALLGSVGTAGSTTCSILPGAYGDTNLTTSGTGMGLVTYDATYGLRPLDIPAEYAASIADGQSQLDNVRYANTSGAGVIMTALNEDTTINSLSLVVTGTNTGGGIIVTGELDRVLTIASGCLYASQTLTGTPNANDVQILAVPVLDLNGHEGVIFRKTASIDNGIEPACLEIRSSIRNDGENGITFVGPGLTYLTGSSASTYTGPTVCQSGYLRIAKGVSYIGVPGTLVVAGGNVQNTGNQIPDGADIIIEAGTYYQKGGALNSGSGTWETFRDLLMTGGTYIDGADGTSSGKTFLTNAVLMGGSWTVTKGHTTEIGNKLALSGGTLTVKNAQDNSFKTTMSIWGPVTVTNVLSGAYTPLALLSGASGYAGAKVILYDDITVVCNSVNTNAVAITATEPAAGSGAAIIALNNVRTIVVNDGAGITDISIAPVLLDNGATAGGLTKSGQGTLLLANTNAYTGDTTVNAGTLALNGSQASPVTVNSGATLTGTGLINATNATDLAVAAGGIVNPGAASAVGTLSVTGDVSFASASVFRVDVDGTGADLLAVSGTVSGGPVTVEVSGTLAGPTMIMKGASVSATFVTTAPGLSLSKRYGTELWLVKSQGTLLKIY